MVRILFVTSLLLPAIAGAAPALAATSSCEAQATLDPAGPDEAVSDLEQTPGSCSASIAQAPAFLNGDGDADVGFLHSRAEATLLDGLVDNATASASAQFRDVITVVSEGRTGLADLHATAFLSGVIDVTGNAEASVRLDVFANPGSSSRVVSETCRLPVYPACFGSYDAYPRVIGEVVDIGVQVVLGGPVQFGLTLTSQARRSSLLIPDAGTALAEFGGGAEVLWLGFDSLSQDGAPIPFEMTSESGIDWTQPVPEPGAMAAAAFAGIALIAVHRSRLAARA